MERTKRMSRPFARSRPGALLAVVLAVSVLLVPGASPAAGTGDHHDSPGGDCVARVDRRLADLDKLLAKVASAPDVPEGHRVALQAGLGESKNGLLALRNEMTALGTAGIAPQTDGEHGTETDVGPEMAALCARIAGFRVYSFRKPQVYLVLSADRVVGQQGLYEQLAVTLDYAITVAGADPDVAKARQKLDSYRAHIAAAVAGASGVGNAIAGLGPADWANDGQVLVPYVEIMHQVKHELKAAKKDARAIIELIWLGGAKA
jgi:hypothetical protein